MLGLHSIDRCISGSLARVFTTLALVILPMQAFTAQPVIGIEYETRIALPSSADPDTSLGVDEAVFRWVIKEGVDVSDFMISAADLEYLDLKIDFTSAPDGDVFLDVIIEDGIVQAVGSAAGRVLADVIWDFEFFDPDSFASYDPDSFDPATDEYDALYLEFGVGKVADFRNIDVVQNDAGAIEEYFFKLETSSFPLGSYEVVSYAEHPDISWDRSWDEAKAYAETQFFDGKQGYLATLTSTAENVFVDGLVEEKLGGVDDTDFPRQAWVGGFQDTAVCEATNPTDPNCGWTWVNGEGLIDFSAYTSNPWLSGEPNDSGSFESFLAINLRGLNGWNDSRTNLTLTGGFVIEFPRSIVTLTLYIDGALEGGSSEDELIQRTFPVSPFTIRNAPVSRPGTIGDNKSIEMEIFSLEVPGLLNVDVCMAPDPREPFIVNGAGRPPRGMGTPTGNGNSAGGAQVFNPRTLKLSELIGKGTCKGPFDIPDDTYENWEALLGEIDLELGGRERGFTGRVDLTPDDNDFSNAVEAVWLLVTVVRSTYEVDLPVAVVNFPAFINYDNTAAGKKPDNCANVLHWRPLSHSGSVPAFGEWPNVEGDKFKLSTVQCNRDWTLTRRTTHIGPTRIDSEGVGNVTEIVERKNLVDLLDGLEDTIAEAQSVCENDGELFGDLANLLGDARSHFSNGAYQMAIDSLEELANEAYSSDSGFVGCPIEANFPGAFVARGLGAAFVVHDRFLNRGSFVLYEDSYDLLSTLKPDLRIPEDL